MAENGRKTAISLMRMALALLDRERDVLGGVRLQQAIDTVEGVGPACRDDFVDEAKFAAACEELPDDRSE